MKRKPPKIGLSAEARNALKRLNELAPKQIEGLSQLIDKHRQQSAKEQIESEIEIEEILTLAHLPLDPETIRIYETTKAGIKKLSGMSGKRFALVEVENLPSKRAVTARKMSGSARSKQAIDRAKIILDIAQGDDPEKIRSANSLAGDLYDHFNKTHHRTAGAGKKISVQRKVRGFSKAVIRNVLLANGWPNVSSV